MLLILGVTGVLLGTGIMAVKMYQGEDVQEPEEEAPRTTAPLITKRAANAMTGEKSFVAKVECDHEFPKGMLMDTSQHTVPRGNMTIMNKHHYEMMVLFYTQKENERIQAVGVDPLETLAVKVPVGKYRVEVLTGEQWCNLEYGFRQNGVKVKLDGELVISGDRKPSITFTGEGATPQDFSSKLSVGRLDEETLRRELAKDYSERNRSIADVMEGRAAGSSGDPSSSNPAGSGSRAKAEKVAARDGGRGAGCSPHEEADSFVHVDVEVIKDGGVTLKPGPDGRFYVTGGINGFPTVFSFSPSDPMVAVSQNTAARAGIRSCMQASGGRSGGGGGNRPCIARVSELSFSGFRLRNVDVSVLPVPNADSVLGLNALKDIKIEQGGATIRLSRTPLPVIANAK